MGRDELSGNSCIWDTEISDKNKDKKNTIRNNTTVNTVKMKVLLKKTTVVIMEKIRNHR